MRLALYRSTEHDTSHIKRDCAVRGPCDDDRPIERHAALRHHPCVVSKDDNTAHRGGVDKRLQSTRGARRGEGEGPEEGAAAAAHRRQMAMHGPPRDGRRSGRRAATAAHGGGGRKL